MPLSEASFHIAPVADLLDPKPMRLETGICRLENGALMMAVRTELRGCKGRMLDWWFKHFDTTEQLSWWHPLDHVAHNGWDKMRIKAERYVGATIRAVESLGDLPPVPAVIKFHEPSEVFGPSVLEQAFAKGHASAVVYGRIGFGEQARLDDNGDPLDGEMVHVVRDMAEGAVLRSRFVLGQDTHAGDPIPDAVGLGLLQHCYTEFSYLAKLLPSLYWGDPANRKNVPILW